MDRIILDEMLGEATSRTTGHLRFITEAEQTCSTAEHVWLQPLSTKERRAMVHACHALRTQIKCFEDEFSLATDHVPRGGERLPLASTYRQYREWKRDIRDHAASRIQSLVRFTQRATVKDTTKRTDQPATVRYAAAIVQLSKEKRHIKQQLKDYDARFTLRNGRPPLKFEKEPIRNLYESYHAVKAEIALLSSL
mmetsp:Transcript_19238/g.60198  ORF Transcript_19238/g.60198 Transcript_19238/m.60198 type:complete len:195 (+) Transcript_19238:576-1160(+)